MTSYILGTGSAVPANIVTNKYFSTIVDTSDEWITDRTGISERRISNSDTTATLSIKAAIKAIKDSHISPEDIDLIIVATLTPDGKMPSTACKVQAATGAINAMCYDINAACTGFMYGLQTAHAFICSGLIKHALIIGAETLSKIIDWTDRGTCVLFGDGAGAAILGVSHSDKHGILYLEHGSDGSKGDVLTCGNAPLINPFIQNNYTSPYVHMNGQEVFKFATRKIPEIIESLSTKSGIEIKDFNKILLHQANKRIIQFAAKRLHLSDDIFPVNLDKYGNTSAASVAILLDEVLHNGTVKPGDLIALAGFGGGLTWAGILMTL